jgi:hypothetical protein
MMGLGIGIEHQLDVTVQRPHDADTSVHQEIPAFRGADQAVDCRLPMRPLSFFGLIQGHPILHRLLP